MQAFGLLFYFIFDFSMIQLLQLCSLL